MAPRYRKSKEQAAAGYARQKLLRQRRAAAAAAAPAPAPAAPVPAPLRAMPWHQSLNKWEVKEYSTGWARPCSKCRSWLLDVEKNG